LLGRDFASIEGMKITDILRAEHTVFHHLFDHIEAVVPRIKTVAEVKSLALLADKVMAPHSRTEDELFIGPLEHCFEQIGQSETFHAEHEQIEAGLSRARRDHDLKAAKKSLLNAVATARKHFDKEERIVFPLAEKLLKSRTLTELCAAWTDQRQRAGK